MRKVLLNLHLYLALIVGLFVVIIGVTGSIMAFEQELDQALNPALFSVEPTAQVLPVADLLAAASKAYPGQRINALRMPQSNKESASFAIKDRNTVYINPYTAEILGARSQLSVLNTIHQIHIRLLLGAAGQDVVLIVNCVLLFLVASGVYLWWPYKRWTVKWKASARRVHFDIHNTTGIYSAVFLLLLGITGALIHYNDEIEAYMLKSAGEVKVGKSAPSVIQAGAKKISPDEALKVATATIPGTKVLSINVPPNAKGSYLVSLRHPEDLTPGGRSWVNVDQYSGKAVNSQDSHTAPAGTRFRIFLRATHTGDILGVTTKILFSLSSFFLVLQAITGYYMWWKKLRLKQNRAELQAIDHAA
ncbi:MAG: PepSY-associated TM helix domain-containing protein [Bryobacteraceae bacterium]